MSADPELGLVYQPVEMPSSEFTTGDYDPPGAPILFDMQKDGPTIKARAQPTKQQFLFVLNRETGEPIGPIEERPVPRSESPYEKTSPTQPFPTWPPPFDRQGFPADVLNDLTPELRAEAERVMAQYRIGPLYTPPAVDVPGGPLGTLMLPADVGGANWPGGGFDPVTNRLYIHSHTHSHTAVFTLRNIPAELGPFDPSPAGRATAPATPSPPPPPQGGLGPRPGGLGPQPGLGAPRGETFLQGTIPMIKPPYDRITAYDMNTGEILWQRAHSTTPDNIRNHPALKGLDVARLGAYGGIFIGTLTTATLVIAGEGDVHTNSGCTALSCALWKRRPGEQARS